MAICDWMAFQLMPCGSSQGAKKLTMRARWYPLSIESTTGESRPNPALTPRPMSALVEAGADEQQDAERDEERYPGVEREPGGE